MRKWQGELFRTVSSHQPLGGKVSEVSRREKMKGRRGEAAKMRR